MASGSGGSSLLRGVLDSYVCSANTAVQLKLISQENEINEDEHIFYPEYTHQFFGDGESVFGYRNLKICLYYSACRLTTYLGVTYTDKITPDISEGVVPDDVNEIIGKKLQPGYLTSLDQFGSSLSKDASFKPFGEKLYSTFIEDEGNQKRHFEVYKCDGTCPGFTDYHQRMQTFVLWFIDAACYIEIDDEKWNFFVMYEKFEENGHPMYAFVGYTTVYHYYAYPSKMRPRISQMLILPPFQKQGLGAKMLQTVYNWYIKESDTVDITVEDPSENFTSLRDFVDAKNCTFLNSFQPNKLIHGFSDEMKLEAQNKLKLNKKQARRVYEILRLRCTDVKNQSVYRSYRLLVKNRLNAPFQRQKNDLKKLQRTLSPDEYKAALMSTSSEQHAEQLEKQYRDLEDEYRRILDRLASTGN